MNTEINQVELTIEELEQVRGGTSSPTTPAQGFAFIQNGVGNGPANVSNFAFGYGQGSLLGFGTASGAADTFSLTGPGGLSFTNGFSWASATGLGLNSPF